jgi:hypothetical protein
MDPIPNLSVRARNAFLAAAIADIHADDAPLALFDAPPRLSAEIRLALATCEAITRSGGAGTGLVNALGPLASAVNWIRAQHGDPDVDAATVAICAAPLAFVLEPSHQRDEATIREVVSIIDGDNAAQASALTLCLALRHGLEHGTMTGFALPGGLAASGIIGTAIEVAAGNSAAGDLESMLAQAASCEHSRHVGLLAGLLLGAAGVRIPTTGFNSLPDRDELDRIVEPFAQLVASGNFAV